MKEKFDLIIELYSNGLNKSQISKITGIPRTTVRDWINKSPQKFVDKIFNPLEFLTNEKISNYSYILGLYLGDGFINKCKRTYRLRISLDKKYNSVNEMVKNCLSSIFNNKINVVKRGNCVDISLYNNNLPYFFPQHGKGKKYLRKIILTEWQNQILSPINLIKGLIHSDGCYYNEKIKNYTYGRFVFTNKSKDIIQIFCNALDILNLEYDVQKIDGIYRVRISKKSSVVKLKEMIGTKENPI